MCVIFIFSCLFLRELLAYNSVIPGFVTSPRMVALSVHDVMVNEEQV